MHDRLIRLREIIGKKKNGVFVEKGILSMSASSFWKGVREKRYPQPIKLGMRMTCWRESEILAIVQGTQEGDDLNK